MRTIVITLLIFIIVIAGFFLGKSTTSITVLVLSDQRCQNEAKQLTAIQGALAESSRHFRFHKTVATDLHSTVQKNLDQYQLLLLSGRSGIEYLKSLVTVGTSQSLQVVWSGRRILPGIIEVAHLTDMIFLPAHVLTPEIADQLESRTKLIRLPGIPHQMVPEHLERMAKVFEAKNGSMGKESVENVGIILGGDAIDEKFALKLFTPMEARHLARQIVAIEGSRKKFIIVNGPRTGSADLSTSIRMDRSPHSMGQVDEVSKAFCQEFVKLGVEQMKFFDFQFSDDPAAYLALLQLLRQQGRLHICGECTSTISEAVDLVPNIVVDFIPSMASHHERYVEVLFDRGLVSLMVNGTLTHPRKHHQAGESAAFIAAREIRNMFRLRS